ncbi:MAG: helix-turn-helix domain-containing protein [Elusimicrobia bacterium]|nr:helix-turn-helix domain-containing protein [Elusimicrobiota bacterium]
MKKDYIDKGFLTTQQVAEVFGRANVTIRKWIGKKKIKPALKAGMLNLFNVKDILELARKENLYLISPPPAFLTKAVNSIKTNSKQKGKEAWLIG